MTRGLKSSEYKFLRTAFWVCALLGLFGIYRNVDLVALAALIPAICSPAMVYAGARSYKKSKVGEADVLPKPEK